MVYGRILIESDFDLDRNGRGGTNGSIPPPQSSIQHYLLKATENPMLSINRSAARWTSQVILTSKLKSHEFFIQSQFSALLVEKQALIGLGMENALVSKVIDAASSCGQALFNVLEKLAIPHR